MTVIRLAFEKSTLSRPLLFIMETVGSVEHNAAELDINKLTTRPTLINVVQTACRQGR